MQKVVWPVTVMLLNNLLPSFSCELQKHFGILFPDDTLVKKYNYNLCYQLVAWPSKFHIRVFMLNNQMVH